MAASFAPTQEQEVARDLFATGDDLAIEAGAGTGKTSTLELLARSQPSRRVQYVAFNRAIVEDGKARFPSHVNCSTAHSLAFRSAGRPFAHRLNARRMRSEDIARRLGVDPIFVRLADGSSKRLAAGFLAGSVMAAVTKFCQTADERPGPSHVPYIDGIDQPRQWENNDLVRQALAPAISKAWADVNNPDGELPYRHDHYLKRWQLSEPVIPSDVIFFDEAQDANPVLLAIVDAQAHAQRVWVGDSQQQIYEFTGAKNALAQVPADLRAWLTRSFRFGPAIAAEANRVLARLGAELRIEGHPPIASTVGDVPEPDAVLTRTNAEAVATVLAAQKNGRRVHLVGGSNEVAAFARAAQELKERGETWHRELACFRSWGEVQDYVDSDPQGSELALMVRLIDTYGSETIIAALDRMIPERDAQLVVSTAHKAKGREWGRVRLASDFSVPDDGEPSAQEWRLLYVAVTRARLALDVSDAVAFSLLNNTP